MKNLYSLNEPDLIDAAKNGDDLATRQIIDQHSGIYVDMSRRYIASEITPPHIKDEVELSKDYVIFSSIQSFDPSRGTKFSTWLANQTKFFCLNQLNKSRRQPQTISLFIDPDKGENPINNLPEIETQNENQLFLIEKIEMLLNEIKSEEVKRVIRSKYLSNTRKPKTYTEIAEEMNVSVQTVINWHNKFIDFAQKKLNTFTY